METRETRGTATSQKLKMHGSPEVTLHASASTDAPSNPLHSQPTTTCFGFRRRSKGQGSEPVMWVRNPTPEEAAQPAPSRKAKASKPNRQRLCGVRDILCSFGSDIFDTQSHRANQATAAANQTAVATLRQPEGQAAAAEKAGALDSKESGRSGTSTPTPKIMASYDSIFVDSRAGAQAAEADGLRGDKEDGADSISIADTIDEDEEYDSFGTPKWTIDPHDIFFISKGDGSNKVCRLGKGEYGPVYLGVWQEQEVAVKLARQTPISLKMERQFQANVALLHGLSHPNIVTFLGACCWKGGKRSVMVTEFMDKSDLRTLLGRADLAPKFAWREHGQTVALDVAHGLQYLHGQGMAHGRLKAGNVLMNKAGVAKLADCQLSSLLSHCKTVPPQGERAAKAPASAACGPAVDLGPPEGETEGGSRAGDIFAFGLVLHELLTQQPPSVTHLRPVTTPDEAPAKIAYLVECCLDEDPQARPTIDKIVSILSGKRN